MTEKTQSASFWHNAWPGAAIACIVILVFALTGIDHWPLLQMLIAAVVMGGLLGLAIRLVRSAMGAEKQS
jgi:uncharacterized integral membrane protein